MGNKTKIRKKINAGSKKRYDVNVSLFNSDFNFIGINILPLKNNTNIQNSM